eukprot:TRINITY_DN3578_c0_g1_i3.p1 TRINITY_DN3578_c0_g1~~TRINITY_DN3578_c0_g1_i3.p1  ORF type:complete len:1543 (-),score=246.29 TRINITY_DN3578_c0_g1_i3:170-4798(-)
MYTVSNRHIPPFFGKIYQSRTVTMINKEGYFMATYKNANGFICGRLLDPDTLNFEVASSQVMYEHIVNEYEQVKEFCFTTHHFDDIIQLNLYNIITETSLSMDLRDMPKILFILSEINLNSVLLVLETSEFVLIDFEIFEQRRINFNGDIKFPRMILKKYSIWNGNRVLLCSHTSFQLIDIENRLILLSGHTENNMILLSNLKDDTVIMSTQTAIYFWTIGQNEPVKILTPDSIFQMHIVSNLLYCGDIAGQVSVYDLKKKELETFIMKNESKQNTQLDIHSQLERRVQAVVGYQDHVITSVGSVVSMWSKDIQNKPISRISCPYNVTLILVLGDTILLGMKGLQDEIHIKLWTPSKKKLLKKSRSLFRVSGVSKNDLLLSQQDNETILAKSKFFIETILYVSIGKKKKYSMRRIQILDNSISILDKKKRKVKLKLIFTSKSEIVKGKKTKAKTNRYYVYHNDMTISFFCRSMDDEREFIRYIGCATSLYILDPAPYIEPDKIRLGDDLESGEHYFCVEATHDFINAKLCVFHKTKQPSFLRYEIDKIHSMKSPYINRVRGYTDMGKFFKYAGIALSYEDQQYTSIYSMFENQDHIKWNWNVFLKVSFDIVHAINYMHSFSVKNVSMTQIHKNLTTKAIRIKHTNPFITETSIILSDFGFNGTLITSEKAYLAPELDQDNYTTHTDIYALGIVLFSLIQQKNATEYDIDLSLRRGFPLSHLVIGCLKANPVERASLHNILKELIQFKAAVVSRNLGNREVPDLGSDHSNPNQYGCLPYLETIFLSSDNMKQSSAIIIDGMTGTGKSSLLRICYNNINFSIKCYTNCNQATKIPYLDIINLIKFYLSNLILENNDEISLLGSKLSFLLNTFEMDLLTTIFPEFSFVLTKKPRYMTPSSQQIEKSITDLITIMGSLGSSLLFVIDDIHNMDQFSLQMIKNIVKVNTIKVLVVACTISDDNIIGLFDECTRITTKNLKIDEIETMLADRNLLGTVQSSDLIGKNNFYISQVLQYLSHNPGGDVSLKITPIISSNLNYLPEECVFTAYLLSSMILPFSIDLIILVQKVITIQKEETGNLTVKFSPAEGLSSENIVTEEREEMLRIFKHLARAKFISPLSKFIYEIDNTKIRDCIYTEFKSRTGVKGEEINDTLSALLSVLRDDRVLIGYSVHAMAKTFIKMKTSKFSMIQTCTEAASEAIKLNGIEDASYYLKFIEDNFNELLLPFTTKWEIRTLMSIKNYFLGTNLLIKNGNDNWLFYYFQNKIRSPLSKVFNDFSTFFENKHNYISFEGYLISKSKSGLLHFCEAVSLLNQEKVSSISCITKYLLEKYSETLLMEDRDEFQTLLDEILVSIENSEDDKLIISKLELVVKLIETILGNMYQDFCQKIEQFYEYLDIQRYARFKLSKTLIEKFEYVLVKGSIMNDFKQFLIEWKYSNPQLLTLYEELCDYKSSYDSINISEKLETIYNLIEANNIPHEYTVVVGLLVLNESDTNPNSLDGLLSETKSRLMHFFRTFCDLRTGTQLDGYTDFFCILVLLFIDIRFSK